MDKNGSINLKKNYEIECKILLFCNSNRITK